jgi:uncharacterized protein YunC (DUF1805 family)
LEIEQIDLGKGVALGIKIDLNVAPILLVKATRGFVMCGYLNMEAAEKLGDVAARVSGVSTFEDVLNAKVQQATTKAKGLGVREGMTGREALLKLF